MASLYDLELQESNNFIHALMEEGMTPALKLMADQVKQAASLGAAGEELKKQLEDPTSDMGKSYKRLQDMASDIKTTTQKVGMTPALAKQANTIFSKSPESLSTLDEADRKIINDYWLKKKSTIVVLLQKGYTHEELFS